MGGNMVRETKQDGKRGKRRRWKARRPNPKPEVILPPSLWSALGLPIDRRWFAAADQVLVELHRRYDDGDRSALLDAIDVLSGFFVPAWVREGFHEAWTQYRQYKVATLDQAFGVARPEGQHLKKARKRELLRWQIMFRVYHLHKQGDGAPLDNELFAAVGRELRTSGGQVAKIFGEPESDELRELLRNLRISD
jgi:hypothetical protein